MNIKTFFYISSIVFSSIYLAHAIETTNSEAYTICKKNAPTHREQTMLPALKEYVESSQAITDKAKHNFEKVSWYIDTSYRINSKKIQDEKKQAMIPVKEKINKVRILAQNTWKAEDSLCEFLYNKATTIPITENKSKKK